MDCAPSSGEPGADGGEVIDLLGDVYEVVSSASAPDVNSAQRCLVISDSAEGSAVPKLADSFSPSAVASSSTDIPPEMNQSEASVEDSVNAPNDENVPRMDKTDNVIAIGRLMKERQLWRRSRPKGYFARPAPASLNPNGVFDIFHWRCVVPGPRNTPWQDGLFTITLEFGHEYPWAPPKCRFDPVIFHPNVYKWGTVCMSLFDEHMRGWNMDATLLEILVALRDTLANPNVDSPACPEAAKMYQEKANEYIALAKADTARASLDAAKVFVGADAEAALVAALTTQPCSSTDMADMETDAADRAMVLSALPPEAQVVVAEMGAAEDQALAMQMQLGVENIDLIEED